MSSTSGGSGRDRDKNRKYASGAAKRKAKEERIARESKVLSKVPKISELFSPTATCRDANAPCNSIDTHIDLQPLQLEQCDEDASRELTAVAMTASSTTTADQPEKPDKSTDTLTSGDPSKFNR